MLSITYLATMLLSISYKTFAVLAVAYMRSHTLTQCGQCKATGIFCNNPPVSTNGVWSKAAVQGYCTTGCQECAQAPLATLRAMSLHCNGDPAVS